MADKKKKYEIGDIVPDDEVILDEDVIVDEDVFIDPFDVTPDQELDVSKIGVEVPAKVRFEVSGLDSKADKLRALQKYYPDAEPVGDNFIMTNPETGADMVLNVEGWMPSWGDVAELGPEAVGAIAGLGGSILGGIGGGAAGTAVPVVGNATGAIAGGIAGGGAGYSAGKNLAQSGINWLYGNDDTRDLGDRALDVAGDFALGAAGEGAGRVVGAGAKYLGGKAINALSGTAKRSVVGSADDAALAAQRLAPFEAAGVKPTPGMIQGTAGAAREQAVARSNPVVREGIADVEQQLAGKWDDALQGYTAGLEPSRAEAGQAIREGVRGHAASVRSTTNALYDDVAEATGEAPAVGTALNQFLTETTERFAKAGQSEKLNIGSTYEAVLSQAKALSDDVAKGGSFTTLKEARTAINDIAFNSTKASEKALFKQLGKAISEDMEATAKAVGDDALTKWQKANAHFTRTRDKADINGLKPMDSLIAKETPESIFQIISSGSKNNGTLVGKIMEQVRAGGGEDAVRQVGSTVFNRLGRNPRGEFSAARLVSDWDQLAPEAKTAFMKYNGGGAVRQSMDDLVAAMKQVTDYKAAGRTNSFSDGVGQSFAKHLAQKLEGPAAIGAAVTSPTALAGVAAYKATQFIMGNAKNKMFSSPETIRWLTGAVRSNNPVREIGKLRLIMNKTADMALKAELRDYISEVENAL